MPELPEVEVVRRGLDDHVVGSVLHRVEVLHPRAARRHELGSLDLEARLAGIPHATTGFISGAAELAEAYAAADLMIYPSRADNQPLAILEAMACGVPAVGFDVGGVPELLGDGRGLVVADGDAGALGNAVRAAVVSGAWRAWGPSARDYVRSRHGLDEFLSAHIKAYRETIENWKERS